MIAHLFSFDYCFFQKDKLLFNAPVGVMPFSCLGKKRAKRSRHKGHCASRSRAPNPSPLQSPAALTTPRSTLTYILSTAKMFRFLPCSGSASRIRQGGESGAAAISKAAAMCRRVVRASHSFFGACGWGAQGRWCSAQRIKIGRLPVASAP